MLSLNTFSLSLLPIPKAKRTKRTGGKAPEEEEANSPDSNLAPEDPDGNAPDEDSGSDTSVGSNQDDEDPVEEFDERELDACGDLESINCHGKTETQTQLLSLSESVPYETLF